MRVLALTFALASASVGAALAEEQTAEPPALELRREGDFIVASDACGASRYAHLVGREYGQVLDAALLPDNADIAGRDTLTTTLEYTPTKLNVVLDAGGRIAAIGCF